MNNVKVTNFKEGPFLIIVSDPLIPSDNDSSMVISPPNGFNTKEEALAYIENFANRKIPYLGLHFSVVKLLTETNFAIFTSWED